MHATATLVTNECSGCGVYIIRTHAVNEDTYTWSCVAKISGDTAELYGALKAPTRAERVAVKGVLRNMRVERVEWERRTGCGRRMTGVGI